MTSLIVALLVAVFTVGYAFAWILNRKNADFAIKGASAGAYFDSTSGDGTAAEFDAAHIKGPFVIANATHMRNLAVLQNTGRFGTDKYYFRIKDTVKEVDMGDLWLPPIGNDDNPFRGEFDGRGKSIKNLKVTTDKSLLTKAMYPTQASPQYEFSNAVGLFGNTHEDSVIRNFILNNPKVLIGDLSSTAYGNGANKTEKVAGIAVGRVAGLCQSIGVRATDSGATSLEIRIDGYKTFNSILGGLDEGLESSVTGGGYGNGSGGSGNAFGASFDVDGMYDRLLAIAENKKSATPAWRLPDVDSSKNDGITLEVHEKLPFTVTSESTYADKDATEVISNTNIGYMVGNQNKVYNKKVEFGDKLIAPGGTNVTHWHFPDGSIPADDKIIPRWIYRITAKDVGSDTYNDYTGFSPLSDAEYNSLSNDILELIPSSNGEVEGFNSVRLSQTYNNAGVQIYPGSTSNGQWSPHGQISWMGKSYGEGFSMTDYSGPAIDENGIRYTSEGYKLDENDYMYGKDGYFVDTAWPLPGNVDDEGFLVDGDGNRYPDIEGEEIKYGGYKLGHDDNGYFLIKDNESALTLDMGWGSTKRVEPKKGTTVELYRYTGGVALPNCGIWFKPSQAGTIRFVMYAEKAGNGFTLIKGTRTNATKDNPFYVDYSQTGKDVTTEEVAKYTMPSWVLFYYEFEVKQEDIDAGNVEYWLMQYGNGGAYFVYMDLGAAAAEDANTVLPDTISAVDFIYDGVEIEQDSASEIGVGNFIVNVSGTKALYDSSKTSIYFENVKSILNIVYLRLHNDTGGNHTGKTICLEGSAPALNTDSDVKATFAAYVCPTIGGGGGTVTPGPGPDTPVAVESVSITGAPSAALKVGDTVTLGATVTPNNATDKTVSWTTSNSSVATIANGVVTAKGAGTVTITATAGGKSDSITITVEATSGGSTTYTFDYDKLSGVSGLGDNAALSQTNFTGDLAFLTVGSGVAYRTSPKCIQSKGSGLSVEFKGTGTITIVFSSTGGSNVSRIGLKKDGTYISASEIGSGITAVTDTEAGAYSVEGTGQVSITFTVTEAGTYVIDCPSGVTGRATRIFSIVMVDNT